MRKLNVEPLLKVSKSVLSEKAYDPDSRTSKLDYCQQHRSQLEDHCPWTAVESEDVVGANGDEVVVNTKQKGTQHRDRQQCEPSFGLITQNYNSNNWRGEDHQEDIEILQ